MHNLAGCAFFLLKSSHPNSYTLEAHHYIYHMIHYRFFWLCTFLMLSSSFMAQQVVYQFDIKEQIAAPVWRTTQLAIDEASDMEADAIVIRMNTYGGAVDAADSIRTKLLRTDIPIYVLIENNAASAGALISLACDSIFMMPGSTIGAATVVNQSGEQQAEKIQSYFREKMRATAEISGRDPDIAEAMVDPDKVVDGVSEAGKIVTLSPSRAMELGFCEGEYNSVTEVLKHCGIEDYTIEKQRLTTIDQIIGWLINPAVSGILILVIFGGIYFELQSPGLGFPIVAAIIAATLYFMPLYLEGLAENWEIILFIVGLVLIGLELFVVPGFGITGIAGFSLVIFGLALSLVQNVGFDFSPVQAGKLFQSFLIVLVSAAISITGSIFLAVKLFESNAFSSLVLQADQKSSEGYVGTDQQGHALVGSEGTAYTNLRPSGKVEVNGRLFDATAESGFIDEGTPVKILSYSAAQVKVRAIS